MVEPFIRMLYHASAEVRLEAASALGKAQDSRSVKHLIPLLKDDDSNVRSCTARVLSGMEDPQLLKSIAALVSGVKKWSWENPVEKNKTRRDLWNAAVRIVYSKIGL